MQSFFRYPGGKSKFKNIILEKLYTFNDYEEYREPFFGGGAIGLNIIEKDHPSNIWINDKDAGISSLWESVKWFPEEFKSKVHDFVPTVEQFDEIKEYFQSNPVPKTTEDVINIGFKKLAIHQISFSGLGVKSGGPLGGRNQSEAKYPIDCRWSPESICKKIDKLHECFSKKHMKITHNDFETVITDESLPALIYLDPPYYDKGQELYFHSFTDEDHLRLSILLKNTNHKWVLSYDDCENIRNLYTSDWCDTINIDANYTIGGSTNKTELLIMSKSMVLDV